ncbi:RNA methyltransferase [Inmirania thermothiophila]|uniref:tRNA (cytidine/uridine-2'-O-)-methyltransferase TrmJ n=1 Tax=Inmirania thermothiophila TaxID=1750597 RepID=A0A3N1Y1U9_9GAMM|nr:RNA methyltransferase [Inmirania thermothiophila]ROR32805.1 tRNA (cytidine32/uridine32-2'-O)-methyltransferase [Inmirania thermothiophila]
MLEQVRIVLVGTTHPGNVGAAARAMKNMGLADLVLVAPKAGVFPSEEAAARASGADDVLARARVCASLDEAVADCRLVVGASARLRSIPWPVWTPREAAPRLLAEAARGPVAVVFGRERSGLTNRELERCNALLHIPANPAYPSLNLAQAVQVTAYELRMAAQGTPPAEALPEAATAAEVEAFFAHLERALVAIGYLNPAAPKQLMRRLRRLFLRVRLEHDEVSLLRGILTAAERLAPRREP